MESEILNTAAEVAKQLLQIKAIKLSPQNPFTWASGIKSPIYCDNRVVLSYPNVRKFVIRCMAQQAQRFQPFNMVAGVATAGIAHGALLAEHLGLPFVYVRSAAKAHGRQNKIEGELRGNERILVVEDLISTGGSSLKAVEALEDVGCQVAGVIAIFSYGLDKAVRSFSEASCPFTALSNYEALLQEALQIDYIQETDLPPLQEWRKDPENWQP